MRKRPVRLEIDNADIRCFEVPKISYEGEENDRDYSEVGLWRKARGKEALLFTAVGFYFAQKLNQALNVPIGIINCTWGGVSASVFIAEEYLTGEPQVLSRQRERSAVEVRPRNRT